MSFTIENEKQNRMSFLHVQIIGEDKTLTTSFYHKPTFGGVYTHFDSFLPSTYKFGIIYTLAYKFFEICSSWTKLHTELSKTCFKRFMDNIHVVKEITIQLIRG